MPNKSKKHAPKKKKKTLKSKSQKLSDFLVPGGIKSAHSIIKIAKMCPLVVYIKKGCPYCAKALSILADNGAAPRKITLHGTNGQNTQNYLNMYTGRRTVPNIFIGGLSYGGAAEIERADTSGRLKKLLTDTGVALKKNNFSLFGN
jgi:glutaredoxin 3